MMKTIATIHITALCGVALLAVPAAASAQQDTTVNRQMILEREYNPSVQDANKVNTLPAVKEPVVTRRAIDYAAFTLAAEPPRELGILPSGSIMTDMQYNHRRGYLHFGGGTYLNLDGDLGYHILNDSKNQLNLFFTHHSTNGKVKYFHGHVLLNGTKVKAKLNDNLGGLNYRYNYGGGAFRIGGKYGYSAFNYYGLPLPRGNSSEQGTMPEIALASDVDTKQVNQLVDIYTGIEAAEDADLGYLLGIDFKNFAYKYGPSADNDGITERTVTGNLGLSAAFGGNQRVGVAGKLNYFNYSIPDYDGTTYNARFKNYVEGTLTPYYEIDGSTWKLKLGVNTMFITGDNKKFFVSPNASASVNLSARTQFYLQAGGEIRSNSAYLLSRENRYIDPYTSVDPSRTWLDALTGFRGYAGAGFWFDVFAGYKLTDDDYFFVPQQNYKDFANYSSTFQADTKRFQFGAALKYAYQKLFELNLKGVYYSWKVDANGDDDWDAFGQPDAELTAGLKVSPVDNFTVTADYRLATGRKMWVEGSVGAALIYQSVKMKNINELNVTGTYTLNDTFGFYIKVNNLLSQKYEYIYGYPLQRLSAMIGVNINF